MSYVWLLIFSMGHAALWVAILNRIHALPMPRWIIKSSSKVIMSIIVFVPIAAFAADFLRFSSLGERIWAFEPVVLTLYAIGCLFMLGLVAPQWVMRHWLAPSPAFLESNDTVRHDVAAKHAQSLAGTAKGKVLALLPLNQMFHLHVQRKRFRLPTLPPEWRGFTIAHLSDLHFTGHIRRPFFEEIVERTNEHDVDIVVITGDVIDKAVCLDWIPEVLGQLRAKQGKYFVLGNHDQRLPDVDTVRRAMLDAGFVDLAGRWRIHADNGREMLVAGTEEPWFPSRPNLTDAPSTRDSGGPFRLLLSHTPDQLPWAKAEKFDLMLAGHTHGGQIRFPLIGPIVAPSLYGVKYASGIFHESPTLMHVSRGLSGLDPIRLNCPPELAIIELL